LFIGPSGIGKTHLLMGLGRALCLAGYRVLFRSAVTLATDLEIAHKELRLPRLLAQYRRFDLVLVDELGYLPFAKQTAELLFQFFSDRYERASVAITSNLAFAQWTQVFGNEQMTVALLDRLVHRSHVLMMEGESFRFRQSVNNSDIIPKSARVKLPTWGAWDILKATWLLWSRCLKEGTHVSTRGTIHDQRDVSQGCLNQ